ncbi:hypothetical protein WDZ92_01055 [Nostoc sp. NIES-2111]
MRYIQPYGEADQNASYRDAATGAPGSRVPAKAVEHPMREIDAAIVGAGLTPSEGDLTQLLQAIDARIAALTGGGPTGGYALVSTIRSNMPIHPEVLTSDGKIPCISPGIGQFRVPAGYNFLHRGYHPVTTVQLDFATAANKTYHCFWDPTNGVQFKDLADSSYNPGAVAETSVIFDSNFDRMLICRVQTDPSNVLTITNLVNRARIIEEYFNDGAMTSLSGANGANRTAVFPLNLARTPKTLPAIVAFDNEVNNGDIDLRLTETVTRYQDSVLCGWDWATSVKIKLLVMA